MRGERGGYGDVLEWGKGRVGIEGEKEWRGEDMGGERRTWEERGRHGDERMSGEGDSGGKRRIG